METSKVRDFKKENMMVTLVLWVILACGCMGLMLYVASSKTIVIADTAHNDAEVYEGSAGQEIGQTELLLEDGAYEDGSIRIPLIKGTKAETVVMENHYMDSELWIYLKEADEAFYAENAICGDLASVKCGYCEGNAEGVVLKLHMDAVQEYRSTLENDTLVIVCHEPEELYEQIVVVDPYGGGSEVGSNAGDCVEKDIVLQIAKLLQRELEQEEIKLYFTRLEDVDVSDKERFDLTASVNADYFISLRVGADVENPENYGIQSFYNEEYFIPQFGNVQLADVLTRNVTIAASNRAIGLFPAGKDSILQGITIPAAEICVGYLSNEQESVLLQQANYQEKLAEGLANAILEVYTNKDLNDEVEEE